MSINRGKQFENLIQEQLEKVPEISIDRLYDVTTGYKNQNNPCDFIVFYRGTLNYIECKAVHGNTLNFKSQIRENQWSKLLQKSYIPGVNAGILVWFIDWDITLFIDIQVLQQMKAQGYKSFNVVKDINKVEKVYIEGEKRRVFFEYDLEDFLRSVRYE